MIILQVKDLEKSYGVQQVLAKVNMVVQEKEKVGLVGPNGAGKTTFLRCVAGQEPPDSGEITIGETVNVGYMEQIPAYPSGVTLFEAVLDKFSDLLAMREELRRLEGIMSGGQGQDLERVMAAYGRINEEYERAGGFACEAMTRRIISGLGFTEADLDREMATFSGGEKTKISLARLLVREPDLLLLDEPTNHLDLQSVEWLESFLKNYPRAVLVISHDRYFLDQIVQRTLDLEEGTLESYPGNYSSFVHLKEEKKCAQLKAYEKQQKIIAATEEYIDRYRAGIKAKQARGRASQLSHLDRLVKPKESTNINLQGKSQPVAESASVVLKANGLSLAFARKLWDDVSFTLTKGEKAALIGPNGVGKTTLLKVIKGEISPDRGQVVLGSRVKTGWFDQEHRDLSGDNQVIDEVLSSTDLTVAEARDVLAGFLFRGDDVFKPVKDLSGGEKGRLSFLKLFLAKPNFLLLDEPTNHLDLVSKTVIEDYLLDYQGTILVISHDRFFLDKITNRTLVLEGTKVADYPGNYSYYREKKRQNLKEQEDKASTSKAKPVTIKAQKNRLNKAQTRERIRELEKEIEETEDRLRQLADLLADPATYKNEEDARQYVEEYKCLEEEIPRSYERWEELTELLADN